MTWPQIFIGFAVGGFVYGLTAEIYRDVSNLVVTLILKRYDGRKLFGLTVRVERGEK